MIRFPRSMPALISPVFFAGVLLCTALAHAAPPPPVADDDEAPASVSHPIVEPTAPSAGKALNTALERLAKDPRSVDALIDAGKAAIALGDNEAALGFFTRADQVAPTNAAVKAAIAGARLHLDDPVEALRWYAEAEKAGADPATFALDRGLAYDLVGDNAAAVEQYRKVLAHNGDDAVRDEATRRLAISLAIGGDRRSADLALLPLLQRRDRAAWRAHVFVLAIAGRGDDAVSVMHATMPADLTDAIGPYLRFVVQLTPAQQAAVASLGRFPRAADIGRDDPRVTAYAAAHPRVPLTPAVTPAQAATASGSEPRFLQSRRRKGRDQASPPAAAPAKPPVEPDIVLPPPPPPPASPSGALAAVAPPGAPMASRTGTSTQTGFDLSQVPGATTDSAPPIAAVVPRPTVLSKLDMPPPHRTVAARSALVAPPPAPATPATPATTLALAAPLSPPTAATVQPGAGAVVTTSQQVTFPPVAGTSQGAIGVVAVPPSTAALPGHAVVQAIPEKPVALKPDAASPRHARAAPEKSAPAEAADVQTGHDVPAHDKPAKGRPAENKSAHAKAAKDKSAEPSDDDKPGTKDKSARAKTLHGKAARDEEADAALVPCKPIAKGHADSRRARAAAARDERSRVARAKSKRHGKGGKDGADSDTCAPAARGDRPDGPGGVSRDTQSDDDSRAIRSKSKARDKDKAADRDSDKKSEKGGKHVRYASRIWVEVLTGADRDKMPGEWRALVRKSHKLKAHKPYLTPWHSNFRLLTGPFDSDADAQDFIAELRKDGVSGFEWTSPAGQAIDTLALP
jgi:tetratricopeptide (TPR) repeat protein